MDGDGVSVAEVLSVEATAQKLVARGYPTSLFDMTYATRFPIRGLLVDVKLGNIIKTDRYRYAKTAYHGTRELSSEERKKLYQGKRVRPGMPRFYAVDTLYALSEVTVFAAVIDTLGATKHRGSLDFPNDTGCTSAADAVEFTTDPNACGQGMVIKQLPLGGADTGTLTGTTSNVASPYGGGNGVPGVAYVFHLLKPTVIVATTDDPMTVIDSVLDLRSSMCQAPGAEPRGGPR